MTDKKLREILRDPSYPRELRAKAFRALVQYRQFGYVLKLADRVQAFRAATGGTFLPELMVD